MSLQSKVLRYLERRPDTWAIKVEVANQRGCPDILCCYRGQFYGIQIKESRDKLSEIQQEQLNSILQAGGRTLVVRGLDDLLSLK